MNKNEHSERSEETERSETKDVRVQKISEYREKLLNNLSFTQVERMVE